MKKKRAGMGCWTIGGVLFAGFTFLMIAVRPDGPPSPKSTEANAESEGVSAVSPGIQMRRDQRRIRSVLRDPDSARFGKTYPLVRDGLPVTCGFVNAKNGFGGYTGERMWIVIADLNVAVVEAQGQEREFGELWNKHCAGESE